MRIICTYFYIMLRAVAVFWNQSFFLHLSPVSWFLPTERLSARALFFYCSFFSCLQFLSPFSSFPQCFVLFPFVFIALSFSVFLPSFSPFPAAKHPTNPRGRGEGTSRRYQRALCTFFPRDFFRYSRHQYHAAPRCGVLNRVRSSHTLLLRAELTTDLGITVVLNTVRKRGMFKHFPFFMRKITFSWYFRVSVIPSVIVSLSNPF